MAKNKYTVRFYRRAWTDITVEARNEEEAMTRADERYNAGDYEDSDEDFENTDIEIVAPTKE